MSRGERVKFSLILSLFVSAAFPPNSFICGEGNNFKEKGLQFPLLSSQKNMSGPTVRKNGGNNAGREKNWETNEGRSASHS